MSKPRAETGFDNFPRMAWRRRLLVVGLAVATAVTIVLTLLNPPGGVQRKRPPPPPDVARCAEGQNTNCVGGTATVIVAPPAAQASMMR